MTEPTVGLTFSWSKRITDEEIVRFAELSGDRGRHHVERDAQGRLMAHGLLTASLPTKLGGDLHFIARTMSFEFLKPVYGGDTLTCVGCVESVERRPLSYRLTLSFEIANQDGAVVLRGGSSGIVRTEMAAG